MKALDTRAVNQKMGTQRGTFILGGVLLLAVLSLVIYKAYSLNTSANNSPAPVTESVLAAGPATMVATTPMESPAQNILHTTGSTPTVGEPTQKASTSTPTVLSSPSSTPTLLPTETPTPTQPTSTAATACNQIGNLEDVTIPSGTEIGAGQHFTKTWIFQNAGSCTWKPNYSLVYTSGSLIYPYNTLQLGTNITPGMSWMLSIEVTAPLSPGTYYDTWKLYTENGQALVNELGQEQEFSIIVSVVPVPTQIKGRIVRDGSPAGAGILLTLEDASNQTVATIQTLDDGSFSLNDVPASDQGYNIVFSQTSNSQLGMDQVLSWVWVGPIPVHVGEVIQLADIDISKLGFGQTSPAPEAAFSAVDITPNTPITFQWSAYPGAADYWVDLVNADEESVWQSTLVSTQSAEFGGTLSDGSHIKPAEYWWAVGARRWLGSYQQIVYTYLTSLSIEK